MVLGSVLILWIAITCSARFARLSPPRLSLCRLVFPLDALRGETLLAPGDFSHK